MESKWDALDPNAAARRRGMLQTVFALAQSLSWHSIVALVLGLAWLLRYVQVNLHDWRAQALRRETRRRYGIPDDDHRPFHVAVNAAAAARRQRELAQRELAKKAAAAQLAVQQPPLPLLVRPPVQQSHYPTAATLVSRLPHSQRVASTAPSVSAQPHSDDWTTRYHPNPPTSYAELPLLAASSRTGVAKLSLRSASGSQQSSTPNVLGRGTLLGRPIHDTQGARAVKRRIDSDSDALDSGSDRKKRARQHIDDDENNDADMDDAADTSTEDEMDTDADPLPIPRRSLKRGRSDAGSLAGDSVRERKVRRKESQAKIQTRGTKRTVPLDSDSETSDGPVHKRGRASSDEEDDTSDADMFDDQGPSQETQTTASPEIEVESACGDHNVDDTWIEDDVQFKVGPDGRRLRLVHLKKVHTRSLKSRNSIGTPARSVNETVVIERWLNDDEYAETKQRGEIAFAEYTDEEDTGEATTDELATVGGKSHQLQLPTSEAVRGGKVLLWDSPSRYSSRPNTPTVSAQPSPNAANTSASKLHNPFFADGSSQGSRRVPSSAGAAQAPQLKYRRSFSRWEKMEAEAEALDKLRRDDQRKQAAAISAPVLAVSATSTPATLFPSTTGGAAATTTGISSLFPLKKNNAVASQGSAAPSSNPLLAAPPTSEVNAAKPASVINIPASGTPTPAVSTVNPPSFSFPATTTASSMPTFSIPSNPLNMAPGDKPAAAGAKAPALASSFSFGPSSVTAVSTSPAVTKDTTSATMQFAAPATSTGSLGTITFGPSAAKTTPSMTPSAASNTTTGAQKPLFNFPAAGTSSSPTTPQSTQNLFAPSMGALSGTSGFTSGTSAFGFPPPTETTVASTTPQSGSAFSMPSATAAPQVAQPNIFTGFSPAAGTTTSATAPTAGPSSAAVSPFPPAGLNAQGRPMRGRSSLAMKPPLGSTEAAAAPIVFTPSLGFAGTPGAAPTPGGGFNFGAQPPATNSAAPAFAFGTTAAGFGTPATAAPASAAPASSGMPTSGAAAASGFAAPGGFSLATPTGGAAATPGSSTPGGFSFGTSAGSAAPASTPGAFSFGTTAATGQQPPKNPLFGASNFQFGQK